MNGTTIIMVFGTGCGSWIVTSLVILLIQWCNSYIIETPGRYENLIITKAMCWAGYDIRHTGTTYTYVDDVHHTHVGKCDVMHGILMFVCGFIALFGLVTFHYPLITSVVVIIIGGIAIVLRLARFAHRLRRALIAHTSNNTIHNQ